MEGPDTSPARSLLAGTKLSFLFKPQHVVAIKENASVDQCLRVSSVSQCIQFGLTRK